MLLHEAYGLGMETNLGTTPLKCAQGVMLAKVTQAIFGQGELSMDMVRIGIVAGVCAVVIDWWLKKSKTGYRFYPMAFAIGCYLPLSMNMTILFGALVAGFVYDKFRSGKAQFEAAENRGNLFASGLIVGEALIGILLAPMIIMSKSFLSLGLPFMVITESSTVSLLRLAARYRDLLRYPAPAAIDVRGGWGSAMLFPPSPNTSLFQTYNREWKF